MAHLRWSGVACLYVPGRLGGTHARAGGEGVRECSSRARARWRRAGGPLRRHVRLRESKGVAYK